MKQNQIRSSEIPLEPWSNEQQTHLFAQERNHRILGLENNHQKQNKIKRPNSLKYDLKSNRKNIEVRTMASNNLREHYEKTLIALNDREISRHSYNSYTPKEFTQNSISPIGLRYYIKSMYSRVTLNTMNIEYFDGPEKNCKKPRSAGKSRKSSNTESSPKVIARPSTSLGFMNRNRSKQGISSKRNWSEINEFCLSPPPKSQKDPKQKEGQNRGITSQFQKMLKIKEQIRRKNKMHSQVRDQERERNIKNKNSTIAVNPEREGQEFEVALHTVQASAQGQIELMQTFHNAPICHERTVKMKQNKKKRLQSANFNKYL